MRVSGVTITKAFFQSNSRDQTTRQKRAPSLNRLGWTCLEINCN
jgi:hypothetical protein